MSTAAMPQPTLTLDLEDVRDDAIQGLIDQGFKRSQAQAAVSSADGSTFSEIFKAALGWLSNSRAKGHPMQTQTSAAKPNGHAVANLRTCKCGCGEAVPAANRFAYINGHRSRSAKALPKVAAKRGRPRKPAPNVEILDAPPHCRSRLARGHRSPTQPISREALVLRQAVPRQLLSIAGCD